MTSSFFFFLFLLIVVLGLDKIPFFFALDSKIQRSVVVTAAIVANGSSPPELVGQESNRNHVRVVQLMVVADPAANHSPGSLDSWVSAEAGYLCWFATYTH